MVLSDKQVQNRSIDLSFGVLVFVLNVLEVYLLVRVKRRKIFEEILLSLSVADLLFGLSNAIICAVYIADQKNEAIMTLTYTTYFFFVLTSILHLSLITADRLWAVWKPIKHRISLTKSRVRKVLILIWVVALVTAISLFLIDKLSETFITREFVRRVKDGNSTTKLTTRSRNTTNRPIKTAETILYTIEVIEKSRYGDMMKETLAYVILAADVLLVAFNVVVIYFLQRKKKVTSVSVTQNMERKVSIICIVVTIAFVVFTLPSAITKLSLGFVPVWANVLLVLNSGVNSIVYFFRGRIERFCNRKQKGNGDDSGDLSESAGKPSTGMTPLTQRSKISGTATVDPK